MKKNVNVNRLASVNNLFADRINLKLSLANNGYNRRNDRSNDTVNGNNNDEDEIKLSNTSSTVTSDEDDDDICQYENLVPR